MIRPVMTAQSSFSGVGPGAATLAEQIPPGVVSGRRPAGDAVATLFVVGLFWTGSLAIAGGGWGGALRTAGQLGVAALAGWATTSARAPRGTPVVVVLVCVLALLTADLGMALWDA